MYMHTIGYTSEYADLSISASRVSTIVQIENEQLPEMRLKFESISRRVDKTSICPDSFTAAVRLL